MHFTAFWRAGLPKANLSRIARKHIIHHSWKRGWLLAVLFCVSLQGTTAQEAAPASPSHPSSEPGQQDAAAPREAPKPDAKPAEDSAAKSAASSGEEIVKRARQLAQKIETLKKKDPQRAAVLQQGALRFLQQYERSMEAPSRPAPRPANSVANTKQPRFAEADEALQRLRAVGEAALADTLGERLEAMQTAITSGEFDFSTSEVAEVHSVSLQHGTTLPQRLRTPENRLRLGYAEVRLQYTARPILLLLKAQESILWNVRADPGVRVHAVVLESHQPQQLMGLPQAMVLETRTASRDGLLFSSHGYVGSQLGVMLAGVEPVTEFTATTYSGQPIVVGPSDRQWLTNFMVPTVESVIDAARTAWRKRRFQELKHLRFQADFVTLPPGTHGSSMPQTSTGEFSIMGPFAETLMPVRHHALRHTISVAKGDEQLELGLDMNGQLVSLSAEKIPDRLTPVPPSSQVLRHGNRFRAFTYDSQRHRMVLATNASQGADVVSFDIQKGEWAKLATLEFPPIAMSYVPAEDSIWLVVSHRQRAPNEDAELWKMTTAGKVISKQVIQGGLGDPPPENSRYSHHGSSWDNAFPQLIPLEKYAILVGLRYTRRRPVRGRIQPEIIVMDSTSGDVVYAGHLRVVNGSQLADELSATPRPQPVHSVLADLNRKLTQASSAIDTLVELRDQRATPLQQRLKHVRAFVEGRFEKQTSPRLYVVGRSRSQGTITVHVTDTTAPVVLVLTSPQTLQWKVKTSPQVKLQQIILASPVPQKLMDPPAGVEVSRHFGKDGFTITDHRQLASRDTATQQLSAITGGLEMAALSVTHHDSDQEITVGPQNGLLRLQMASKEARRILDDATEDQRTRAMTALLKKRFFGVHRGTLPRQPPNRNNDNRYWSKFNIHGPLIGTGTAIPQRFQHAAYDDENNRLFGVYHNQLMVFRTDTGAQEQINLGEKNQRLGQIMGAAYDSKRQRLILLSHNQLFAFDPTKQKLTSLRLRNWLQEHGMTYSTSRDVFYAAVPDRHGQGEVRLVNRYNGNGVLLDTMELSTPVARGQRFSSSSLLQVIDLDSHIAIISGHDQRFARNGRRQTQLAQIAVVDVTDGRVIYEGQLRPQVERKSLSDAELANLWTRLGPANVQDLDRLLWEMAAGHQASIDFIRKQIQPVELQLEPIEIAALVKDLDDNRFSVRNQAFQQLQSAGSSIEPHLQAMMNGQLSSEVTQRLKTLIDSWSSGEPQNDEERRRVRCLEVLARIGSNDARELLQEFRGKSFDAVTRRYAAKLMLGATDTTGQNPAIQFQQQLFVPR